MARIVNSRCVLAVRDLEVSTRYYVEILGFRKDPIDAAGWSFLTRDSFRVMLGECADERPAGELGNHSYFAYWNVEGVDELYRELVAKGAITPLTGKMFATTRAWSNMRTTSKPIDKPWGLREFGLSTPDGHRIVCGEVI
jgi:catechol 2,3-dioxygenase-like lactoylglutathione lyase family enzyme